MIKFIRELKDTYSDSQKSYILSGNDSFLYQVLTSRQDQIVKVELKSTKWGDEKTEYHIIQIVDNKLYSHTDFAPIDLQEYSESPADSLLKLENVDLKNVLNIFVSEKGILN